MTDVGCGKIKIRIDPRAARGGGNSARVNASKKGEEPPADMDAETVRVDM